MRKILICLSLYLVCVSTVLAVSMELKSVIADKYIDQISGERIYDKPVTQTELSISLDSGLYTYLWNSTPFKSEDQSSNDELGFGLGWGGHLPKSVDFDLGAIYYDEPTLMTRDADDSIYSYVKLSKVIGESTVYLANENYSVVKPGGLTSNKNYFSVGASLSESQHDLLYTNVSGFCVYDLQERCVFLKGNVELDWKISKYLSLVIPQLNYYMSPMSETTHCSDVVASVGVKFEF